MSQPSVSVPHCNEDWVYSQFQIHIASSVTCQVRLYSAEHRNKQGNSTRNYFWASLGSTLRWRFSTPYLHQNSEKVRRLDQYVLKSALFVKTGRICVQISSIFWQPFVQRLQARSTELEFIWKEISGKQIILFWFVLYYVYPDNSDVFDTARWVGGPLHFIWLSWIYEPHRPQPTICTERSWYFVVPSNNL